jgi:hypothetical protein
MPAKDDVALREHFFALMAAAPPPDYSTDSAVARVGKL